MSSCNVLYASHYVGVLMKGLPDAHVVILLLLQVSQELMQAANPIQYDDFISEYEGKYPELISLLLFALEPVATAQEARQRMLQLEAQLRTLDVQHKGGHTAAADILHLYACTQV